MEVFPLEEPVPGGILNGSNPSQLEQMKEWDASLTQLEKVLEAACQRSKDDQPKMASQLCSNSSHIASSTSDTFINPSYYSNKKDIMWKHPGISHSEQLNSKGKKSALCTVTTMEPDSSNSVRSSNGSSCSKEREISTPPDSPLSECELSRKDDSDEESDTEIEERQARKDRQIKKKRTIFERCNIRDILMDTELDAETLAAQREEQERIRRLQETQQRAIMEAQQRAIIENQQRMLQQQLAQAKPHKPDQSLTKFLWDNHMNWLSQSKPSNSTLQMNFGHPLHKSSNDVIQLDSSEDEQPSRSPENNACPTTHNAENVIDISSSDEENEVKNSYGNFRNDDDVVMLSDEEGEIEDPNNSGSHTNDLMNQPDSEGRVMVNIGHPEEDPDIFLAPQLARNVKPHQIGGIRFLYDNVVESLERFQTSTGFGCILAHSMGLGKTVQVISFIDIYLRHTSAKSVLCIVPINTIQNWMSEFDKWLPQQNCVSEEQVNSGKIRPRNFNIYLLNENYKTTTTRAGLIFEWQKCGGVLLMGYEMYRLMALKKLSKKGSRRKKRQREENPIIDIEEDAQALKLLDETYLALVNPGPDLVICDEGHRIKNCQASTSMALKSIRTKRRVVLTGYPLQNSMLEYWCMVDFVRPSYLGTRTEFCNMFDRPIQNGQCIDSTPRDRQLMRFRSHVLHSLLIGFVQRRGHSVLQSTLPRKEEHVLLVRMTPIQRELYRTFVKNLIYVQNASNPLKLFAVCCKVWNHPDILYNILQNRKSETGDDNDLDFDLGNLLSATSTTGNKVNIVRKKRINKDIGIASTPTIPNGFIQEPMLSIRDKLDSSISYDWAIPLMTDYIPGILKNSHKMTVLFSIIEQTLRVGDKLLVFSQSLFTLDLIERFLNQHNVPLRPGDPSNDMGHVKWSKNKNYFRLDGSTSPQDREKLINEFNSNSTISLFLLSTRAGCLGINLIGANRIVVVDASWNPCHDAQAVCRIYRYGQQKPCYIYRLVSDNSLEKRIYDRQVNKQGMSDRVVDELNPESNFTWKEVTTLIHDNEQDNSIQDLSSYAAKYNDEVLRFLCMELNECLSREPFQHESLLLDRKELKLTKHEKRLAKQSYEMEKRANMTGNNYNRASVTSIFPGNPLMSTMSPFNFQGTNRNMPWLPPNASLLPSQSTPLPMQPLSAQGMNPLQHRPLAPQVVHNLLRQGVVVQHLTVPSDVNIPGNTAGAQPVLIGAGQEVLVMKTQKGMYLNLPDGRIVAIRLPPNDGTSPRSNIPQNAAGQTTAKLFEPAAASRSQHCIGIAHQSLQCGGTVFVPPGGNSAGNGPPEVIDLSDDDSDHGEDIAVTNEAASSETPISNEYPETEWPKSSPTMSSMQYGYNQQTAKQPHIPTEIETPPCEVG